MVKFGLPVFLRFGLMVKNSALRFSYNSAFRIRPNGPVRLVLLTYFSKHLVQLIVLFRAKRKYAQKKTIQIFKYLVLEPDLNQSCSQFWSR